jgi:hypothetical protein
MLILDSKLADEDEEEINAFGIKISVNRESGDSSVDFKRSRVSSVSSDSSACKSFLG